MSTSRAFPISDLYGVLNSALCVAHCVAMPVLISLGAAYLSHPLVSVLFIVLAGWAVRSAMGLNTSSTLRAIMWTSWLVFVVSLLLEDRYPTLEWTGISASVGLILGHLYNMRRSVARGRIG